MSSLAGRTLSHYKVLGELSRGGMGIVYRARDVKLGRDVAFKVLPPELVAAPERRRRFEREARAAASLSHPNIGVVHEIDDVEGVTFIAMELIAGESLKDELAREAPTLRRGLELATQVAEGLARAHEKGIVHRDLKPGNVMVTLDGQAKIIDFGLAKALESTDGLDSRLETEVGSSDSGAAGETEAGAVMGTAAYMSPEQAQGKKVDARSDIFSFGVVLFELLTGERPFGGPSRPDVLHAIVAQEAPRLELAEATPELQRIVDKCLAKDPAERYQGMRDVAVDLKAERRRLETGSGQALSSTHAARRSADAKRSPRVIGALLTLLAVGLGLGLWLSRDRGPGAGAAAIDSVVALPATVYGSENDAFLTDAVPNTITTSLSQVEGLVTKLPPSSVELAKFGRDMDKLVRAYAVAGFVLSSVSSRAGRVTVSLQLVEARTRNLLWSREYEGPRDDFIELLHGAAAGLHQAIRPGMLPLPKPPASPSGDAAELAFQRGLYYANRFATLVDPAGFAPALAAFEEALRLNPRRADAAAQIATLHARRTGNGLAPAAATRPDVELWAHRAIDVDPHSAEAWAALASAERDSQQPNYRKMLEYALRGGHHAGPGENMLASVLSFGCYRLGLELQLKAGRENPLYFWPPAWAGLALLPLDRSPEGLKIVDEALALEEQAHGLRIARPMLLIDLGRLDDAHSAVEALSALPGGQPVHLALRPLLAWRRGEGRATAVSAVLQPLLRDPRVNATARWQMFGTPFASILARHGAPEVALDLLETLVDSGWGAPAYDWLALGPEFRVLRVDPRYRKLLVHSRSQFEEMMQALGAAEGRGELPAALATPLERLRAELADLP